MVLAWAEPTGRTVDAMEQQLDARSTDQTTAGSEDTGFSFSELSFEELEAREAPTFLLLSYEEEPR
jgi:hypothetical protein